MTSARATAVPPPRRVVLKHSEVMASAIESTSRLRGGGIWFTLGLLALLCLAVWAGHLLSFWLAQQLPFSAMFALGPWMPVLIPAVLSLLAVQSAIDLEQARANSAYLSRLAAIGAPLEREGSYEVTPDALVLTTERMVLAPRWEAIDTVERGTHGWVLSADQLHFLIPFAAFEGDDDQRPLLAAIVARMNPEARARSRDAVDFAEAATISDAGETSAAAATPPTGALPAAADGTSAIPAARGWLTQDQAFWAASLVHGKVAKAGFHRWAYPFTGAATGFAVGMLGAYILALLVPAEVRFRYPLTFFLISSAILLSGGALGLAYSYKRLGNLLEKAWNAGLEALGVPEQIEAEWRLTEAGIAFRTARFAGEATYASIHQVLHEHGYWIVAADSLTLCIPDGAFVSPDAMRAFTSAILARISEPARGRSTILKVAPASAS